MSALYSYVGLTGATVIIDDSNISFTGAWSISTSYVPFQAVTYNGRQFICVASNTGQTPPAHLNNQVPTFWSSLILIQAGLPVNPEGDAQAAYSLATLALVTAWAGTDAAAAAYIVGTNAAALAQTAFTAGTNAQASADSAYSLALQAIDQAWSGTNDTSIVGTNGGVQIGALANGTVKGAAFGDFTRAEQGGVAVGRFANGENDGVAIGLESLGANNGVAVGLQAKGSGDGNVAIGKHADATGPNGNFKDTVELGNGQATVNGWCHFQSNAFVGPVGQLQGPFATLGGFLYDNNGISLNGLRISPFFGNGTFDGSGNAVVNMSPFCNIPILTATYTDEVVNPAVQPIWADKTAAPTITFHGNAGYTFDWIAFALS